MLLHLGDVHFGVTGPVHYTLNANEAITLCALVQPHTVIPVHYEGWSHFLEGRTDVERAFAAAPEPIRRAVRWVPLGEPADVMT